MSALPQAEFKATCAHEYSHAWVFENVPLERRKTLSRDAHEGFCELLAYLLMNSLNEESEKKRIVRNAYTRGQIDLFIEAEKKFGINDILDWMRWGVGSRLIDGNLADVRNVEIRRPKKVSSTNVLILAEHLSAVPDTLVLKGISGTKVHPLALINDQTFGIGESGKVRVGNTNVLVRCLGIEGDAVRIQIAGSSVEQRLRLNPKK